MDPIVMVIVLAVGMPLAVVFALAYSARLRGPRSRRESRRRVGALVTEAIPEADRDEPDVDDEGPAYSLASPPPEPDPGVRDR